MSDPATQPAPQDAGIFAELGASGLKHYSGYVREEWHPNLSGALAAKTYREMDDNSPVLGAFQFMLRSVIRPVEWRAKPAEGGGAEADDAAELLESCMADMQHSWAATIVEASSMSPFGFAIAEKVYKRRLGDSTDDPRHESRHRDGRIGWRKLAFRAQESVDRWDIDTTTGDLRGVWQLPPSDYRLRYLPRQKFVHFRTSIAKDNPEGRSHYRNAYTSYFYAKRETEIEGIGIERDLAGYPVATVPLDCFRASATEEQKATLAMFKDLASKIRRDANEGAVIPAKLDAQGQPTGYDLFLLNSGGRRPIDINEIIKRHESRMMMSVLAEFILTGVDRSGGSWAMHDSKSSIVSMATIGFISAMAEAFDQDAVPELMRLNGFRRETWPTIDFGDLETPDLGQLVTMLSGLTSAGLLVPTNAVESQVWDTVLRPMLPGLPPWSAQGTPEIRGPQPSETDRGLEAYGQEPIAAAPDTTVSDVTYTGVQVTSAKEIAADVQSGKLQLESGVEMLQTFYRLDRDTAIRMAGKPALDVSKAKSFDPPEDVSSAAARGLKLRERFGRGGTEIGVARARDLSNGRAVSPETVGRMASYFARHAVDAKAPGREDESDPSAGWIAWLLWGGDAGREWADGIMERLERQEAA